MKKCYKYIYILKCFSQFQGTLLLETKYILENGIKLISFSGLIVRQPWTTPILYICPIRPNGIPKINEKPGNCWAGTSPTWSFIFHQDADVGPQCSSHQQHVLGFSLHSSCRPTAASRSTSLPLDLRRLAGALSIPLLWSNWTNYFLQLISKEPGSEWIIHEKSIAATSFCSILCIPHSNLQCKNSKTYLLAC